MGSHLVARNLTRFCVPKPSLQIIFFVLVGLNNYVKVGSLLCNESGKNSDGVPENYS